MKFVIRKPSEIEKKFQKYNNKKLLIISGKKSFFESGAKNLIRFIKSKNLKFYVKRSSIPELKELKKIIALIKKFKPDIIFSVGGGAVMDLGKTANFLWKTNNLVNSISKSSYNNQKNYCKLVAIPTTAGSGAEVTSNSVIYINKKKFSVENKNIKPNEFYLFPKLVLNNKGSLKSSSGFDAIAQAVESLISVRSNTKSVEFSIQSLKYSLRSFLKYLKNPNLTNSEQMQLAAYYSGKAIDITKTTAPHALSYPFTSHFGISHGHAVSLTFSEFIKYNFENMHNAKTNFTLESRLKILLKLTQTQSLSELIKFFDAIKQKAKLEDDFKKLNINLNKNLKLIMNDINLLRLKNNPIELDYNTIKEILLKKI